MVFEVVVFVIPFSAIFTETADVVLGGVERHKVLSDDVVEVGVAVDGFGVVWDVFADGVLVGVALGGLAFVEGIAVVELFAGLYDIGLAQVVGAIGGGVKAFVDALFAVKESLVGEGGGVGDGPGIATLGKSTKCIGRRRLAHGVPALFFDLCGAFGEFESGAEIGGGKGALKVFGAFEAGIWRFGKCLHDDVFDFFGDVAIGA